MSVNISVVKESCSAFRPTIIGGTPSGEYILDINKMNSDGTWSIFATGLPIILDGSGNGYVDVTHPIDGIYAYSIYTATVGSTTTVYVYSIFIVIVECSLLSCERHYLNKLICKCEDEGNCRDHTCNKSDTYDFNSFRTILDVYRYTMSLENWYDTATSGTVTLPNATVFNGTIYLSAALITNLQLVYNYIVQMLNYCQTCKELRK
jgi:hypothetical protein